MRKIGLGILIGLSILVFSGIVVAQGLDHSQRFSRLIVPSTSFLDKIHYRLKGCKIIHELNDATALSCPTEIEIKNAFEDGVYHIMDLEADAQINADDVWALGYKGSGVTVAVLDTGIDTDHPELVSSIAGGKGFGYAGYEDDHGHGTHVSGIITADGVGGSPQGFAKGVAPDTQVWMAKVCDASGSCYTSDIAAAIEYVVNNNIAKIMSISLGGGGTSGANCDTDYLAQKVNWAVNNGVTVVAAAGNTSGKVSSPGCASKAIAVGAVNKSDVRASWSGTGLALDIMAPGVSIYSSVIGGYATWSGTSMATPHISAVVALLKQVNSALTDAEIKDALYKTAKDLGTAGWDKYYGWGRVDALAAVNYVKPPEPECTVDADCDPRDNWYNIGSSYTCCNGNQVCTCQDQEYRDYYCSGGTCIYNVTGSQTVTSKCTICNDNNECTTDSCDATLKACSYTNVADNTPCTNGVCCSGTCTIGITQCPTAVKCWSADYQYLYRNSDQASKFCKCASGIYGYKNYNYTWSRKTVYYYLDIGDNENWDVTSRSSYLPVYQVTCTNSNVYPTNQDYWYPK